MSAPLLWGVETDGSLSTGVRNLLKTVSLFLPTLRNRGQQWTGTKKEGTGR